MTVAEALRILQDCGCIRRAFMPGMLLAEYDRRTTARVDWFDGDGGQRVNLCYSCPSEGVVHGGWIRVESDRLWDWRGPVLTDAATVGVLTALLREAWKDPTLCAVAYRHRGRQALEWDVSGVDPATSPSVRADTEGEAVASALIRLAEEVERG